MEIVVPVKLVPDLVEDLELTPAGDDLDRTLLTLKLNEFDEHALEEALQLKAQHGGRVTVLALDSPEVDEALWTCLARGADRAIKVAASPPVAGTSRGAAAALAAALRGLPHELILTGVQAADDRDGQVGVWLAEALGLPHVSVVSGVELAGPGRVSVRQEYAGGVMAELEVELPCVLGIQAARVPPRYAPVTRVRQVMKTARLEVVEVEVPPVAVGSRILRLRKPEGTSRAELLEGPPDAVAERLAAILRERGFVKP
jgi:electron transfer flavoprotein beta subunit